jgi:hypothetical protein
VAGAAGAGSVLISSKSLCKVAPEGEIARKREAGNKKNVFFSIGSKKIKIK